MPARSPLRALRAAMFAAVCVALGLAGHAVAAGDPVAWWAPVAATAVLAAGAWGAAARERGLIAIGGGLLAAQAALHTLFGRAERAPAAGPSPDRIEAQWLDLLLCHHGAHAARPAHHGSVAELLASMGLDPALAARPPALGHAHPAPAPASDAHTAHHLAGLTGGTGQSAMLAVHLLAAAGTAVWLWRGERALHRILRAVTAAAVRALALVAAWARRRVVPARRPAPTPPAQLRPPAPRPRGGPGPRGPPLLHAA